MVEKPQMVRYGGTKIVKKCCYLEKCDKFKHKNCYKFYSPVGMDQGRVVGVQGMGVEVGEEPDPSWLQPLSAVWLDFLELQKQPLQGLLERLLEPSASVRAAVELKRTSGSVLLSTFNFS